MTIDADINELTDNDNFLLKNQADCFCCFQVIYETAFDEWKKANDKPFEQFVDMARELSIEIEMAYAELDFDTVELSYAYPWYLEYVPRLAKWWVDSHFKDCGFELVDKLFSQLKKEDVKNSSAIVNSSHGTFLIDPVTGIVNEFNEDSEGDHDFGDFEYSEIYRFNLQEWKQANGGLINSASEFDILDLGAWYRKADHSGGYIGPDIEWRNWCKWCQENE